MRITPIDARLLTDKTAAHEYIARALDFPEYYGKNLDALADCLSELSRDKYVIVMNTAEASGYASSVIEVLCEVLWDTGRVFIVK